MKHMNKWFCAFAAVVLVAAVPAYGQIIEEDDGYNRDTTEKFFGKANAVFVNGSSYRVFRQSVELGYDTSFDEENGRVYFTGVASHNDLELDLERTGRAQRTAQRLATDAVPDTEPNEITREVDESDFDVKDAFVQYNALDNLQLTLGRRRVAWGQFDLFSPVNLALPLTPQTDGPVSGKIDTLEAQDQAAVSWFPSERVELQGYFFLGTNLDWLIEDVIESDTMDNVYTQVAVDAGIRAAQETMPGDLRDLSDHNQYAARALFYLDWGTLGFTYHKGRDVLAFFRPDLATVATLTAELPSDAIAYNIRRHTDLPEATNYGVEIAVPYGQWVYKLEVLHQESFVSLNGQSLLCTNTMGNATMGNCAADGFQVPDRAYYDRVLDGNGGRLYVPVDRNYIGIGADSDRDEWRYNLSLFIIQESFDGIAEELIELEKAAGWDDSRGDTYVFPAINIAHYLDSEKESEVGFVGGFLGAYAGASLYYTARVGENFRWLAGIEAISNLRDQLISETEDPDNPNRSADDYELADDLSPGFRLSLTYDF